MKLVCPVCRRRYQVRVDGTVRYHADHRSGTGPCPGTGQHPARPVPTEDIPTGHFGGPRPDRPPDGPDPHAAAHRATLAAALRAA